METTCVDFHLNILRYGGISIKKENLNYRRFSVAAITLLLAYDFSILSDVVLNIDDFDVVLYSMHSMFGTTTAFANAIVLISNGKELHKVLIDLQFLSFKLQSIPAYENWLDNCIQSAIKQFKIFIIPVIAAPTASVAAAMGFRVYYNDADHWELPFGKTSLFNPDHSPNFEAALLFQSIGFGLTVLGYLMPVLLSATVCYYMAIMFKILSNDIKNIININCLGQIRTKDEIYLRRLRSIACHHQILLKIALRLELLLSPMFFIYLFGFMLVLTCLLSHVVMHPLTDTRILKDAVLGTAGILQIFVLAYCANEMMLESQLIKNACYHSEFFECDIRFKKHLAIMMVRSQKPVKFTAGKFADLTLSNFLGMLKIAFSFFNVFRSIMQAHN